MKTIVFHSGRPTASPRTLLLVVPAGTRYDSQELGDALYGEQPWERVDPPMHDRHLMHVPKYLLGQHAFTFDSVAGSWEQFLDTMYSAVDLVLFYSGTGEQYYEIRQQHLALRQPEAYTFTCMEFRSTQSLTQQELPDMADDNLTTVTNAVNSLLASGWTASAISAASGVTQVTIGSIRHGKSQRVSNKVIGKIMAMKAKADEGSITPPKRGRKAVAGTAKPAVKAKGKPGPKPGAKTKGKPGPKPAAKVKGKPGRKPGPKPKAASSSIVNTNYVPVNVSQLQAAIDSMIKNFSGAIADLEAIRKQLNM